MALTESTMLELGTQAPAFALKDVVGGALVRRDDFAGRPLLVMFICNHCPYVKHLADELARFARQYQARRLAIVGISSNDPVSHPDDAPDKMAAEASARGYSFPYLFDETQEIAHAYRAACTPDFFLFDNEHRLVYRGQFDSTRPRKQPPETPTGEDLRRAVDALLAGRPIPEKQYPSLGCNIKWKPGREPHY
jgi:peroxiredoxin